MCGLLGAPDSAATTVSSYCCTDFGYGSAHLVETVHALNIPKADDGLAPFCSQEKDWRIS